MSRRANVINYLISLALTMAALFAVVFICNSRYVETMWSIAIKFVVGALIAGLANAFVHEFGHVFAGKKNGFTFHSMNVWFFKWTKIKNRLRFDFVMMGEEAGYTEMIPTTTANLDVRLRKMTNGAIIASFIMMFVGVPPLFIVELPVWVFSVWAMFLPIGVYYFFGNVLPTSSLGVRNDGAVVYGLRKNDDSMKVAVSVLAIQAEMYNGKTPSEVDEKFYFDVPQLAEDDPNFALLLNARYNYYLDKGDYENAKKTTDRLLSLIDYLPKSYAAVFQVDALYNACTFDFNENVADDLMYELEKYLNDVNNAVNVRAKMAYLLYVKREKENLDIFYKKGIKEAQRCAIKGLGAFEKKLFDKIKADSEQ